LEVTEPDTFVDLDVTEPETLLDLEVTEPETLDEDDEEDDVDAVVVITTLEVDDEDDELEMVLVAELVDEVVVVVVPLEQAPVKASTPCCSDAAIGAARLAAVDWRKSGTSATIWAERALDAACSCNSDW